MHKNIEKHLAKIEQTVFWLARWGVSDAETLCRVASIMTCKPGSSPAIQARHWPRLMVDRGFAEAVDLPTGSITGARKAFVAKPLARRYAIANGINLTDTYRLNLSKLEHRLIAQRVMLDLCEHALRNHACIASYTAEPEMKALSAEAWSVSREHLNRWPDGLITFTLSSWPALLKRTICIEVEKSPRSSGRLAPMLAGLVDLVMPSSPSFYRADAALVLVKTPAATARYKAATAPGTPYEVHRRAGLEYVPSGHIARMPDGIHVVCGWTVDATTAELVTHAQRERAELIRVASEL